MASHSSLNSVPLSSEQKRQNLIENRITYTLEQCELSFYETFDASWFVPLQFNNFLFSSMMRGKKVMHLSDRESFTYLPGESMLIPSETPMNIDFPESDNLNPTQCLGLEIDQALIHSVLDDLNEAYPRADREHTWNLQTQASHFRNDEVITHYVNQLILACVSDDQHKDQRSREALQALLLRVMQLHHLRGIVDTTGIVGSNALAHVVEYIRANIHEKLQIDDLSDRACMSRASFFRNFKREFGISPLTFIQNEKISRAKFLLQNTDAKVVNVSYELGFADVNYFIRFFKKTEGITPFQYRIQYNQPSKS